MKGDVGGRKWEKPSLRQEWRDRTNCVGACKAYFHWNNNNKNATGIIVRLWLISGSDFFSLVWNSVLFIKLSQTRIKDMGIYIFTLVLWLHLNIVCFTVFFFFNNKFFKQVCEWKIKFPKIKYFNTLNIKVMYFKKTKNPSKRYFYVL